MNAKLILLAVAVAVIGAGTLMMCDDSEAAAGDVLASGSCGTSLTYEVRSLNADDSQVEVVISGSGTMNTWTLYSQSPWSSYAQTIISAVFPAGLTNLGDYAFYRCTGLTLTELPAGLTTIGSSAFNRCTGLTLTELPAGLTTIGSSAFSGCTGLTLTELPAGLTTIGSSAFSGCTGLTLTELPAGLTTIGSSVFNGCTGLTLTELPAGITKIDTEAFSGCTGLTLTELPAGLTTIGSRAFLGCTGLTLTELPAGLTTIGQLAFSGCDIESITMPAIQTSYITGLEHLKNLTFSTIGEGWTASNINNSPQYTSRATLQSITFADDRIPSFALYGQNLDTLTITNASGPDVLGIYTAPTVKATASALTVDGTAAQIVRLTDVRGAAELLDGGINLNDVDVHWDTSPHGYATGEVDASPEVLVYPAGIHTSAPNQYAGLINAIPLIVIVAIITTIIGMMAVRRD